MKKRLILTACLAFAMGLGVAVGAHHAPVAKSEAAAKTTMYLDTNKLDWYGNLSRAYLYGSGGNNGWPGVALTQVEGSIYKLEVENMSNYQNVIFLRTNGTDVWNRTSKDGGTAITLPSDWTKQNMFKFGDSWTGNEYDDGNYTGSWTFYEEEVPTVTHSVHVYVNGSERAGSPETIADGALPAEPAFEWGKSFSGWCSDADCKVPVTGITSDTTVYGKVETVPTVTYTIDDSRVSYGALKLYAFEPGNHEKAAWPGEAIVNKTITVPEDATIIINNGDGKQTVNVTQSKVANDTLRILADLDEMNCNLVQWASDADEPASDGYYVVSSKNGHKYKDAPKMDVDPTGDNDAIYYGYSGLKDETIKVRMYEAARPEGADVWSFFVPNEYSEGIADIDESGNLVFLKDAEIDIYALWEPAPTMENPDAWALHFYISEHAVRHYISIYDVLFEGKRLASTAEVPHVARATEGVNFEYELPAMNGYFARKLYTDAACTVEYTPTKYSADGVLYAKYTRLGVYMTGDETYSGAGLDWDVDGATYLSTIVNDPNNQLEGSVTIPASASTEHPVSVKALRYIGDEDKTKQWEGVTYKLGAEYSFCSLDKDSNLVFTKGGTFAIYINKAETPEIYLNEGAAAFYTKFLADTGAVCREDNKTDTERLGEVWDELEGVYNSLSSEEKAAVVAVGFNGGDEKGDDLHKVIARYHYIVWRYGSEAFKDFIFNTEEPIPPHPHSATIANEVFATASDNNIMIIVIASAVALSMAMVTLIIIKKKKFSK